MKKLKHFFLYFNFFQIIAGLTKSFVYEMYASNESNGNPISSFNDSSINKCVALCDSMFGCLSVNFHEVNKQCELTDYYPLDNTTSGIPNNGWKIFFRRNFGKRFIFALGLWFREHH
jgi:hypothetical protein